MISAQDPTSAQDECSQAPGLAQPASFDEFGAKLEHASVLFVALQKKVKYRHIMTYQIYQIHDMIYL